MFIIKGLNKAKRRMNKLYFILPFLFLSSLQMSAQNKHAPKPLKVGYSVSINSITPKNMSYAKSVGISCINVSLNPLVDKQGNINLSDSAIKELVNQVKKDAADAGIEISAFHMPFGEHVDLSLIDETARQKVVALHKKLLHLCAPLKPHIVLFHPSWYLSLNEREEHIHQMVKSTIELNKAVKDIGAMTVIENMTGPELYVESKGVKYERPLCRTVEETMQIMSKLPADVYAAVDMNHILHPEKLILALGNRLKFVHIADGDGAHELHYLPCSGKGMNDWTAILAALYQAGYQGPFMYECHYKDVKELTECYEQLYKQFITEKNLQLTK